MRQALLFLLYQQGNWGSERLQSSLKNNIISYMVDSEWRFSWVWSSILFFFHHAAIVPSVSWPLPEPEERESVSVLCALHLFFLAVTLPLYLDRGPWGDRLLVTPLSSIPVLPRTGPEKSAHDTQAQFAFQQHSLKTITRCSLTRIVST